MVIKTQNRIINLDHVEESDKIGEQHIQRATELVRPIA
jgi:hypothetical protein